MQFRLKFTQHIMLHIGRNLTPATALMAHFLLQPMTTTGGW